MKRFYADVAVGTDAGGFTILLDGKPIRTPERTVLTVRQRRLAEAIASEWAAQATEIRPTSMPLMQLATTAMDRVRGSRDKVVSDTASYVASDLLCYRADDPPELASLQSRRWDSALEWFEQRTGLSLAVARGIVPVTQPAGAIAKVASILNDTTDDDLMIALLSTSLTSSSVLGLAFTEDVLDAAELFESGFVDELYQQEKWGRDEEAAARLAAIRQELIVLQTYRTLTRQS